MTTINEIVKEAHETAKAKGWWDTPRTGLEIMALIHSEVSEAVECIRERQIMPDLDFSNANNAFVGDSGAKPVGLPSELADIIIRIADYCGHEGIDLEAAIMAKMAYNKTRSYRHGNKAA